MDIREIDMQGKVCPSTLLIALREMNTHKTALRSGTLKLVLVTDNRDATVTVPDAATTMGYAVSVAQEGQGSRYRIEIQAAPRMEPQGL